MSVPHIHISKQCRRWPNPALQLRGAATIVCSLGALASLREDLGLRERRRIRACILGPLGEATLPHFFDSRGFASFAGRFETAEDCRCYNSSSWLCDMSGPASAELHSRAFFQGAVGGAEEGGLVVEDHEDGGVFHQTTQAAFVVESVEKRDALDVGEQFHGDASAEEDAAGGHGFEGHVRGFGTEATHENIERLGAHRALARIGEARDHNAGVLGFHRLGDGGKFGVAAGIAEEFVDIFNAHAGSDALGADMDELLDEVFEEGDLEFIARSEVGVAALAGPDKVAVETGGQGSFSFIFSDTNLVNFSDAFSSLSDKTMRWIDLLTLAAFFTPRCSAIHAWDTVVFFHSNPASSIFGGSM